MVFIIAEIGTNHLGDVKIARRIIDVAANAGCDAVKFQKRDVEKIYNKFFLDSTLDSPWGTTQREMRTHIEFSDKQFREIDSYCKKLKIPWFVSCWDIDSQIAMRKFKTKYNQVDSDVLGHQSLMEIIAKEKLVDNAAVNGNYLMQKIQGIQDEYSDVVSNARGSGLFAAFDLPDTSKRDLLANLIISEGALILGSGKKSIRFRPHLNISKEEIDLTDQIIRRAIARL